MKQNSSLYIFLLVGIVSAFGPFVTDFYLPAFPALSTYFETSASMVQLTLTVSMVGLAIGQLFIGPLSDRYGRIVANSYRLARNFLVVTSYWRDFISCGLLLQRIVQRR